MEKITLLFMFLISLALIGLMEHVKSIENKLDITTKEKLVIMKEVKRKDGCIYYEPLEENIKKFYVDCKGEE